MKLTWTFGVVSLSSISGIDDHSSERQATVPTKRATAAPPPLRLTNDGHQNQRDSGGVAFGRRQPMDGRDFGCSGALRQKEERKRPPAAVSNGDHDDGEEGGVKAILLMLCNKFNN